MTNSKFSIAERAANLARLPSPINRDERHVAVGDIHGNALKLIYVLLEEGVMELTDDSRRYDLDESLRLTPAQKYAQLYSIYKKEVEELSEGDIGFFRYLINGGAQVNKKKAVTLIGDELADRGNNDYFTLLVLERLHKAGINIDIMVSNHSVEFIKDYENGIFTGIARLGAGQAKSLSNMRRLIERKIIRDDDVRAMVDSCYKPMVKAIGYTIAEDGSITLFSHAPIGLETVKAIAQHKRLGIPYDDSSPKALIKTIDAINDKVRDLFSKKELASLIVREEFRYTSTHPVPPDLLPLYRLVWNRHLHQELETQPSGPFKVQFVHGHIGDGESLQYGRHPLPSHTNLDTSFAKYDDFEKTGSNRLAAGGLIRHYTRQSNDLTTKELTPERLHEISERCLQVEQFKQIRTQFNTYLEKLNSKARELILKAEQDPKYGAAGSAAVTFLRQLRLARDDFFSGREVSTEQFTQFQDNCRDAIAEAREVFNEHRSTFASFSPLMKGILGVLAVMAAFIPAIIVACKSQKGYWATFFGTPATDSAEHLDAFEKAVNDTKFVGGIESNIQSQVGIKQKLTEIKGESEQSENSDDRNLNV